MAPKKRGSTNRKGSNTKKGSTVQKGSKVKKGVKRERKTTAKPPPSKIEPNPNGVNWVEKLPAEVRNQIYREVLIDPEIPLIDLSTTSPPLDPPLLGTNKQVRSEARPMFYLENKFRPLITDFDASALVRWLGDDPKLRDKMYPEFQLDFSPYPPKGLWHRNVSDWIENYLLRKVRRPVHEPGVIPASDTPDAHVIELFDRVDRLLKANVVRGLHRFMKAVDLMIDEMSWKDFRWAAKSDYDTDSNPWGRNCLK